jgi:glycosyltransferase involved in cell wall biosynthesis
LKIGIATVQVPFITGGAETLAVSLRAELMKRGFEADIISIPFKWYPPERILDCMLMGRLMDLSEVNGTKIDRVIALKFPAYFAPHDNKVGWILHQHRQAYDLYGTDYGDLHQSAQGQRVAEAIRTWDNQFLTELRNIFTISNKVTDRLTKYNNISANTLYPPPGDHEKFHCDGFGDYILYPGRFAPIKRQHLIVEAMKTAPDGVKLVLIGSYDNEYGETVTNRIAALGLQDRVKLLGTVTDEEKIRLYSQCLAVYNGVYEEDYGYVTLEAFLSSKPVITHHDSGGPLEFVRNRDNGFVAEAEPEAIGDCISQLVNNQNLAREMGNRGKETIEQQQITWTHVIDRLLS